MATPEKTRAKIKSFADYMTMAVLPQFGTNTAVADALGLTTGSRIGYWIKGEGVADETNAAVLASLMGDDPLWVLRLCGHERLADALSGKVVAPSPTELKMRPALEQLRALIDSALVATPKPKGGK